MREKAADEAEGEAEEGRKGYILYYTILLIQ